MMTVRFPSGFSVQYNDACRVSSDPGRGFQTLWGDAAQTKWIARVPVDCIVEGVRPCRTYNANALDAGGIAREFKARIRDFSGYDLVAIKAELAKFNATKGTWKR